MERVGRRYEWCDEDISSLIQSKDDNALNRIRKRLVNKGFAAFQFQERYGAQL
jgi:hypothetical protein